MSSHHGLPIIPHLLDLLHAIQDDGISLTLAGGLGIYLKRAEVVRRIQTEGLSTLQASFPEARATSDMDLFVHLELFADHSKEARLREVLCGALEYEPRTHYWQFTKRVRAGSGGETMIKVDLMAKEPTPQDRLVKAREQRVGTTLKRPTSEAIHGRRTPEAFAIDARPLVIRVEGQRSSGASHVAEIRLPHPFASLMMKLQATLDHARARAADRQPRGHRHAFDVYLLLAMMSQREWDEACVLARETYAEVSVLRGLKAATQELFVTDDAPGCIDIRTTLREIGEREEIDLRWTREILAELMG